MVAVEDVLERWCSAGLGVLHVGRAPGLLVPAGDNNVKVLHGSSHGRGIYTSKTNNTALSFGFSKGLARPLLICAVLDDAVALPSPVRCGNHYITAESAQVRCPAAEATERSVTSAFA